jgi:hypothetical protein
MPKSINVSGKIRCIDVHQPIKVIRIFEEILEVFYQHIENLDFFVK